MCCTLGKRSSGLSGYVHRAVSIPPSTHVVQEKLSSWWTEMRGKRKGLMEVNPAHGG